MSNMKDLKSKSSRKKAKTPINLENFLESGKLTPYDFEITWSVLRLQREKINYKLLDKFLDEGSKYKGKSPLTKYNSWYYVLYASCEDFDKMISEAVGIQTPPSKRKELAKKIQESRSFGILQALLYDAKKGCCIPQFSSLKECQKWCDKKKIEINVYEIYSKTKQFSKENNKN